MFFTTGMAVLLSSVWLSKNLTVQVLVSDSKDVQALKSRVLELEDQCQLLQARYNALEFKYGKEVVLSCKYLDLLKEHGISWR